MLSLMSAAFWIITTRDDVCMYLCIAMFTAIILNVIYLLMMY